MHSHSLSSTIVRRCPCATHDAFEPCRFHIMVHACTTCLHKTKAEPHTTASRLMDHLTAVCPKRHSISACERTYSGATLLGRGDWPTASRGLKPGVPLAGVLDRATFGRDSADRDRMGYPRAVVRSSRLDCSTLRRASAALGARNSSSRMVEPAVREST